MAKKMGERIKESRMLHGYTIEYLAGVTGISPSTLDDIEKGTYVPRFKEMITLVEALDESPSYIVFNMRNPRREYLYDKIAGKLDGLTHDQIQTAEDILDAYIKNLK